MAHIFQEDQDELEHITRTELAKYEKEKQTIQNEITKTVTEVWSRGYKTFIMLSSAETKIYPAHKC